MAESRVLAKAANRGNLIAVTEDVARISPFHVFKRREVTLSANPNDGDCYSASFLGKTAGKDNLALSKNGILKLAKAAGISVVVDKCKPVVFDRERIVYESVVSWRGPDGTLREAKGSVEIDLAHDSPEMEALREECKTMRYWDKQADGYRTKPATPEEAEAKYIAERARLKKFMLPMAESKSLNRAIRCLLQLKQKYSATEIGQPFFVEVVEYSPDLSDQDVRASVLQQGAAAAQALYGTAPMPALAAPQQAAVPEPVAETWTADASGEWSEGEEVADAIPFDPVTGEVLADDATITQELTEGQSIVQAFLQDIGAAENLATLTEIGGAIRVVQGLTQRETEALRQAWDAKKKSLG